MCVRLVSSRAIHWLSWMRKLVPSNDPCSENQEKQSPWQLTTFPENCLITPFLQDACACSLHVFNYLQCVYKYKLLCEVKVYFNMSLACSK